MEHKFPVFVVEDDDLSRMFLVKILQAEGYEVISESDGKHSLEILLQPNAPKLILLDWNLPSLSGLEICKKLRETDDLENPRFIIMVSIRTDKGDTIAGLTSGANDYIVKPYYRNELISRVNSGKKNILLQEALNEKIKQLSAAKSQIRTLEGILPICMYCHKILTDEKTWEQLEEYISEHTDAMLSHSICPVCEKQQKEKLEQYKKNEKTKQND